MHRRDCPNLAHINEFEERSVEVQWEAATPRATRRFQITARMTSDLFSEIEGAIRKYRGHLIEGKLEENDRGKPYRFLYHGTRSEGRLQDCPQEYPHHSISNEHTVTDELQHSSPQTGQRIIP